MGRNRWRMHNLVRLYAHSAAADALSVEQRQAILERVTAYYAARLAAVAELADGVRKRRIDPARLERQLLWLDRERPTLLGLIEQLAAEHVSLLAELFLDLAVVAADGLTSWPEMPRLSRAMLAAAQQDRNARLEAWALYHQALDLLQRGATQKALELLGRSWKLAVQTSDQGLRDRVGHALHAAGSTPEPPSVAEAGLQPPSPDGRLGSPGNTDGAAARGSDRRRRAPPVVAGAAGLPPRKANPEPVSGTTPASGSTPAAERSTDRRAASKPLDRWAIVPPESSAGPVGGPSRQRPSYDPFSSSGPERGPGHSGPSGGPGPTDGPRPSGGPGPTGRSGPTGHPDPAGGAGPQGGPSPSGAPGPQRGGHRTDHPQSRPADLGWEPQPAAASQGSPPRSSRVRQATETVRGAGAAPSTPMIFG